MRKKGERGVRVEGRGVRQWEKRGRDSEKRWREQNERREGERVKGERSEKRRNGETGEWERQSEIITLIFLLMIVLYRRLGKTSFV